MASLLGPSVDHLRAQNRRRWTLGHSPTRGRKAAPASARPSRPDSFSIAVVSCLTPPTSARLGITSGWPSLLLVARRGSQLNVRPDFRFDQIACTEAASIGRSQTAAPGRNQSCAAAEIGLDPDECFVAKAIVRRAPAGGESDRADRGSGTLETGRRRSSAPERIGGDPDESFVAHMEGRLERRDKPAWR